MRLYMNTIMYDVLVWDGIPRPFSNRLRSIVLDVVSVSSLHSESLLHAFIFYALRYEVIGIEFLVF